MVVCVVLFSVLAELVKGMNSQCEKLLVGLIALHRYGRSQDSNPVQTRIFSL